MLLDELSKNLGVSRRRAQALAQSGELRAERLGSMWVVDPDDLAEYKLRRKSGRPITPAVAWQILASLSGAQPAEVDRMVAYRARQHLLGASIVEKVRNSRRFVDRYRWRVLADDLVPIRVGGVLSGVPAAEARWFDVVAADSLPKVYVARSRVEELVQSLSPLERSTQPNVEVLVPSDGWVLGSGVAAPAAVVAADLLLDVDPRVRRAAEHHLESLQAAWKVAHDRDS